MTARESFFQSGESLPRLDRGYTKEVRSIAEITRRIIPILIVISLVFLIQGVSAYSGASNLFQNQLDSHASGITTLPSINLQGPPTTGSITAFGDFHGLQGTGSTTGSSLQYHQQVTASGIISNFGFSIAYHG
jgi:hypothetical protein